MSEVAIAVVCTTTGADSATATAEAVLAWASAEVIWFELATCTVEAEDEAEAIAGMQAVPIVAAHRVMVRARFRAALSRGLRCEGNACSFLFGRLPG